MRIRRFAGVLILAVLPLAAQVPPGRFERIAQAPSEGWYRVNLDPATRGRMTPDARDLRIVDASGAEVPYRLLLPPKPAEAIPAAARAVRESPDGWELVFDLGASTPPHHAFRFEFANRAAVSDCRLESGRDGASWRLLARGDLFRLGEGEGLSRTSLAYPATSDRYLRLIWPKGGDYPDVRRAEALPAPPSPATILEFALSLTHESDLPAGRVYLVSLPGTGAGLKGLRLAAHGAGALSYRLCAVRQGRWETVAEGTLTADPKGAWPDVAVEEGPFESPVLRLEVASGVLPSPSVAAVWGSFQVPSIFFHAGAPGAYRFTYGSLGMAPPQYPSFAVPSPPESVPLLVLGPERDGAPAGLPAARAGLGAALPEASFSTAWPVNPGLRPGELARLELPGAVYAPARTDLGDLRLESGGRQVPYLLHAAAEPVSVWRVTGLIPSPGRIRGESEILLPEVPKGMHLTALELRTSASAFHRPLAVHFVADGSRPGLESPPAVHHGDWSCAGASALPCRLVVPLWGASPGGKIRVVFQDGDNPALSSVDALLWRRGHTLFFLAPEGPARLLAGSPNLQPPRYDLASLASQILAMPSQAADLGPAEEGGSLAGSRTVRLVLVGALILCGAVLLLILARALKRPEG
ncbi:MAG: DUF3999 family protein [Acidobacteriota bacterium]